MTTFEKINECSILERDLEDLEQEVGLILPEDFRLSCLQHNGADAYPSTFKTKDNSYEANVQFFYSVLSKKNKTDTISYMYKIYDGRLPDKMVPIGVDGFGNQICLHVLDQGKGGIYYWDLENETEGLGNSMKNFYLISESFTEFIQDLYEIEI